MHSGGGQVILGEGQHDRWRCSCDNAMPLKDFFVFLWHCGNSSEATQARPHCTVVCGGGTELGHPLACSCSSHVFLCFLPGLRGADGALHLSLSPVCHRGSEAADQAGRRVGLHQSREGHRPLDRRGHTEQQGHPTG